MKRNKNFNKKPRPIATVLTVNSYECGDNAERMIRKFIKKVKRDGILEEARERRYFKKPTAVRAERKRNRKRLIEKTNKERDRLLTTAPRHKKRSR